MKPKSKSPSVEYTIGHTAEKVIKYIEIFNDLRKVCDQHAFNTLTKDHNCFHGRTKTECNPILCPMKGK